FLLFKRGKAARAEEALLNAYRLLRIGRDSGVATNLEHMSELRAQQRDFGSAGVLIERAIAEGGGGLALWYLHYQAGRILA
ncbi:hypothetical protein ABTN17_21155, partial [Acinetobacter baumannii]